MATWPLKLPRLLMPCARGAPIAGMVPERVDVGIVRSERQEINEYINSEVVPINCAPSMSWSWFS